MVPQVVVCSLTAACGIFPSEIPDFRRFDSTIWRDKKENRNRTRGARMRAAFANLDCDKWVGLEHDFPAPPDGGHAGTRGVSRLLRCVVCGCVSEPDDCIGLGALLTLDDIEFHVIALFQSFIAIQLYCRVMNEDIRSVIASDESVALGVVEPLDLALELSHRDLPFLRLYGSVSEA